MDKIGKIIVQEKEYDLAWNGGVKVRNIGSNTINIETDLKVFIGDEKTTPKDYVLDVISRAVREFLYQDITPFALAGSNSRYQIKTFLIDTKNKKIVSPDKGLNSPTVICDAPNDWIEDTSIYEVEGLEWSKRRSLKEEIEERQKDIDCIEKSFDGGKNEF